MIKEEKFEESFEVKEESVLTECEENDFKDSLIVKNVDVKVEHQLNTESLSTKEEILDAHILEHQQNHTDEKSLTCEICNTEFTTKSSLYRHNKRYTEKRRFSCENCGKTFFLKSHLILHKSNLTSHLRIHSGQNACDLCDETFTHRKYLNRHKLIIHRGETPFSCAACGCLNNQQN
ncbi:zinc finger protein-like [Chrysoperla carnea]|uniref:zinc finger protein-like n=1 Tax=Chrysoperla carnea TaxID=189513 RepID=UPI001D074FB7|nr:zinc finger protein-like [Chrysoperla carnea]